MGEKFLNLSGLTLYDKNIKEWTQNEIKPSDWSETDESSKTFINNKPFGEFVNKVNITGLRPTASAQINSEIENLPIFAEGDLYTVVYDGQTYNDLEVVFKSETVPNMGSMSLAIIGNTELAIRRVLAAFGLFSTAEIGEGTDNGCDFYLCEMLMEGNSPEVMCGKFVGADFVMSESSFSWTLKNNDTKADICSTSGSYNMFADMLGGELFYGSETPVGSYYLDADEMALMPAIEVGTKLEVSVEGREPEIYEFHTEDFGGFPLYMAGNNEEDGSLYFVYSPSGGMLQIQMGLDDGEPLFMAVYKFNPEIDGDSVDLSINLTTTKKLDKSFYDVDWSDVDSKPFYEEYGQNQNYLNIDNTKRSWVKVELENPEDADITGWLKSNNDNYGYAVKTDNPNTSGYNPLYTLSGLNVMRISSRSNQFLDSVQAEIDQGYPYESNTNEWSIPVYCANNAIRITPTGPDSLSDPIYEYTAAHATLRITFKNSERTYDSVDKCYLEDIWLCGTEGTHFLSLGYYTFPSGGGSGRYNHWRQFSATCPAVSEGSSDITVYQVRSDYYFPADFDEATQYKVTYKGQEYTLYPYHVENVRIVGEVENTWDGVLPFKPYDCLTPTNVGNEIRYSGWILGDVGYLERRFGIRLRDVSSSEYISTSSKAINFCMFRIDKDTHYKNGSGQYSESCLIISDVVTGESASVGVDVPVYHTINKNYLPIDKISSNEINEMFV